MADLTLSDGREVNFDVSKMTIVEYRGLFVGALSPDEAQAKSDTTLARISGMTVEALQALPFPDVAKMVRWLLENAWAKARVPNSASASTTPSSTAE